MAYIHMNEDRSERVLYDREDFPVYIRRGRLSSYPNYAAESHWHEDIELIFILSGEMQYNINGEAILLREGEGVFINARQLHFGYSDDRNECVFLCVLLHPILLCASESVERRYVSPLLFQNAIPYCHLKESVSWERKILSSIQEIYAVRADAFSEWKIQRAFLDIWIAFCENAISMQKPRISQNHHLVTLKEMISFINRNYREKLSLSEIAASGNVGKTGCCQIFGKYIHKTPNEYLTELRLRKATELLKNTDRTVLEISCAVGFSGASYFSETFRRVYGCTPSEYRKKFCSAANTDSTL